MYSIEKLRDQYREFTKKKFQRQGRILEFDNNYFVLDIFMLEKPERIFLKTRPCAVDSRDDDLLELYEITIPRDEFVIIDAIYYERGTRIGVYCLFCEEYHFRDDMEDDRANHEDKLEEDLEQSNFIPTESSLEDEYIYQDTNAIKIINGKEYLRWEIAFPFVYYGVLDHREITKLYSDSDAYIYYDTTVFNFNADPYDVSVCGNYYAEFKLNIDSDPGCYLYKKYKYNIKFSPTIIYMLKTVHDDD